MYQWYSRSQVHVNAHALDITCSLSNFAHVLVCSLTTSTHDVALEKAQKDEKIGNMELEQETREQWQEAIISKVWRMLCGCFCVVCSAGENPLDAVKIQYMYEIEWNELFMSS